MKEQRCYVCGRTAEEAMSFLEDSSDFGDRVAAREKANKAERQRLKKEVSSAVARGDREFLRTRGLEGLMATDRLLERYGDWNRRKLEAAARFGYPFDAGDQKALEELLYNDDYDSMYQAPRTLSQIRKASETKYAELLAKTPSIGGVRDLFNVTLEPWGVFDAEVPGPPSDGRRSSSSRNESVQVTVCLCSVCKKLMRLVALDSLPNRLLNMDSYYVRD
ncbi:MAG: hypothetical protein IKH39_00640 [Candidatus Methanomethylophilaceae archaeon]|nr:hypothetical protein [Candidatus Methanomethylophilaceae archaeon]MBR4225552.1 hypothetical protein [Candidatus Methanomethylophilaceae archaeon]